MARTCMTFAMRPLAMDGIAWIAICYVLYCIHSLQNTFSLLKEVPGPTVPGTGMDAIEPLTTWFFYKH